jgi:hypothetical protein
MWLWLITRRPQTGLAPQLGQPVVQVTEATEQFALLAPNARGQSSILDVTRLTPRDRPEHLFADASFPAEFHDQQSAHVAVRMTARIAHLRMAAATGERIEYDQKSATRLAFGTKPPRPDTSSHRLVVNDRHVDTCDLNRKIARPRAGLAISSAFSERLPDVDSWRGLDQLVPATLPTGQEFL